MISLSRVCEHVVLVLPRTLNTLERQLIDLHLLNI